MAPTHAARGAAGARAALVLLFMLLTQLLSASTLAVPVWAHSTYHSNSDPDRSGGGNPQFIDQDHSSNRINNNNNYNHPFNSFSFQGAENSVDVYPYPRLSNPLSQQQQQQQQLLSHREVEEYTKIVNRNGYTAENGVEEDLWRSRHEENGAARRAQPERPIAGQGRDGVPLRMASSAAASGGQPQRTSTSNDQTIVKKNWSGPQSSLQTKSLTRNNVRESFNRNYFLTSGGQAVPYAAGDSGARIADVAYRTQVTQDVTNVRTEKNEMWTRSDVENRGVLMGSNGDVYGGGATGGGQQRTADTNYSEDGVNRNASGGGDRVRNGVRVPSAKNPYAISEGGEERKVYMESGVWGNNNNRVNGKEQNNQKKVSVDTSARKNGGMSRISLNSVDSNGSSSSSSYSNVPVPTRVTNNNNNKYQDWMNRNRTISYRQDVSREFPTTNSSTASAAEGVNGEVVTDFWNNYGK